MATRGRSMVAMRPAQDAGRAGATDEVDITDANLARPAARIKAGRLVTWTNPDSFEHTATAAHGSFSDANERRETAHGDQ